MSSQLPLAPSDIATSDFCPGGCRDGLGFDLDFTMAFQPIVRLSSREVFAYEALVRGTEGQGAGFVLSRVNQDNRYAFDQACRVKAIELASKLRAETLISINFLPNAVYEPRACLRVTVAAAKRFKFPLERLMFEIAETEEITDLAHLSKITNAYGKLGLTTALDDFGAGWSSLNLLAEVKPHIVKLDMALCQKVHENPVRKSIAKNVTAMARDLGIDVIAEGVETEAELEVLQSFDIDLFQGFLFARPQVEALPTPSFP